MSQVVREGQPGKSSASSQLSFYLDGAHTRESMSACGVWFADTLLAERKAETASTSNASANAHRMQPSELPCLRNVQRLGWPHCLLACLLSVRRSPCASCLPCGGYFG